MSNSPKVCVLGLGYVGLPTAALMADAGATVIGVDVDPNRVHRIAEGENHSSEPALDELVRGVVGDGRLLPRSAPEPADVFIICVQTPVDGDHRADLSAVRSATESIVPHLKGGDLVMVESTCPPGTTESVVAPILAGSGLAVGRDVALAYCPERVLPGNVVSELIGNDRIIGGIDTASSERARDVFATFVKGELHLTDAGTAEVVKLAENTYRDVNIALANQLAGVSDSLGVDVWEVIRMANKHPRVDFLSPGPGVGGHCIPVDPWFLVQQAPDLTQLIRTAREVNDRQPGVVVTRVSELVRGVPKPRVAILGLAYKGNVGDARESPARSVIDGLLDLGHRVASFDPLVNGFETQVSSVVDACTGADCVVVLTDHDAFLEIDPASVRPLVRHPQLFDTRNFLDHLSWNSSGFEVTVLGAGRRLGRTESA